MFERAHHQRIAEVLNGLDGALLKNNRCLFGGGTAIALLHGEYRESVDLDFLVSDLPCYRNLRQLLTAEGGVATILRQGRPAFKRQPDCVRRSDVATGPPQEIFRTLTPARQGRPSLNRGPMATFAQCGLRPVAIPFRH